MLIAISGAGLATNYGRNVELFRKWQRNFDATTSTLRRRGTRHLAIWHVIFFVYVLLLVRLIAMADLGVSAYQSRMAELSDGNWIERAASVVMRMDPVSRDIAMNMRSAMKSWTAYREAE